MGQQTNDSKFSEYGLASIETGLPSHHKHSSVLVATKKTALRDIQNANAVSVSESVGSALPLKESQPSREVNILGSKRSMPESFLSSHQSLTCTPVNGHLVYVRRKFESDTSKNGVIDNKRNKAIYPHSSKVDDGKTQEKQQMNDSDPCVPDTQPIPRASPECFSSEKPSVSAYVEKSNDMLASADSNIVRVTSANSLMDYSRKSDIQQLEERYCRLQSLLKKLDQTSQTDYVQKLRLLSSVDLSRHAVALEKRSIQLSLEEAKEIQRVRFLDVLRQYPKNAQGIGLPEDHSRKAQKQ